VPENDSLQVVNHNPKKEKKAVMTLEEEAQEEEKKAFRSAIYEPILQIDNWRTGEPPFILFEVAAMDNLWGPTATSYVVIQAPVPGDRAVLKAGPDAGEALAAHKWHAKRRREITQKHGSKMKVVRYR